MSGLRIGLDYRPALLLRSGIGRYAENLARWLPAVDPELSLSLFSVFWHEHEERVARARPPTGDRVRLAARRFPGRVLDLLGKVTPLAVESFMDELDVFHFTDYVRPPVRTPATVFTLHDASYLHDEPWHEPRSRERLREVAAGLVARAQVVICVSEATRREAIEYYALDDERLVVAPLGVDEDFFAPYERVPQRHPQVLAVGTIEPRKNHARLLDAFEIVLDRMPEARLVLAGREGWMTGPVRERLARPGLGRAVRWVGEVSDDALLALMRNATVLAYPSLLEGFGLPVLEGMAVGVPVLSSDRSAMAEVAGDAALLVDPTSVEAIAAGLLRLLEDEALREDLAERGRARARTYTWRRCAERTLAAYRLALEMAAP